MSDADEVGCQYGNSVTVEAPTGVGKDIAFRLGMVRSSAQEAIDSTRSPGDTGRAGIESQNAIGGELNRRDVKTARGVSGRTFNSE